MTKIPARQAASLMKRLTASERDAAIAAAGSVVIDKRAYFTERRKQHDLALAYRRPTPPRGAA